MLEVGTKVVDFTLPDKEGKIHHLSQYRGKKLVIYFYPEDDSPGCTEQACSFMTAHQDLAHMQVVLLGISPDSIDSHKAFSTKYGLPFSLLSDVDKKVSSYFGAYGMKNMYGKMVEGIIRSTFIINEEGIIEKVFKRAFAKSNADSVLAYLKG